MGTLVFRGTRTDASDTFLLWDGVILRNRKNLTIIHWFKDDSTRIQNIYYQESLVHFWSVNCCCCRHQGNGIFTQLYFYKIFLNWDLWVLFSKLIQWSIGKSCPLFTKGFPGDSAKPPCKQKLVYEHPLLHQEDTVTVSVCSPSPAGLHAWGHTWLFHTGTSENILQKFSLKRILRALWSRDH